MSVMNFINTKAKACIVFLFSMLSLGILIISTFVFSSIFKGWYGIIFGIILIIISIPFHISAKKNSFGYLISFALNSIANGLALSALYYDDKLSIFTMLISALPAAIILFLVYLMLQIFNKTKKVTVIVACILNFFLSILMIILLARNGNFIFNFGFFCSVISFLNICVFAVTINHDERSVLRDVSYGSFSIAIIVAVIVSIIISDGDVLDGVTPDIGFSGEKRKK